jgi:hypothetical protein
MYHIFWQYQSIYLNIRSESHVWGNARTTAVSNHRDSFFAHGSQTVMLMGRHDELSHEA